MLTSTWARSRTQLVKASGIWRECGLEASSIDAARGAAPAPSYVKLLPSIWKYRLRKALIDSPAH